MKQYARITSMIIFSHNFATRLVKIILECFKFFIAVNKIIEMFTILEECKLILREGIQIKEWSDDCNEDRGLR